MPGRLTTSGVSRTIIMTADWLKGLGVVAPRVALAAIASLAELDDAHVTDAALPTLRALVADGFLVR